MLKANRFHPRNHVVKFVKKLVKTKQPSPPQQTSNASPVPLNVYRKRRQSAGALPSQQRHYFSTFNAPVKWKAASQSSTLLKYSVPIVTAAKPAAFAIAQYGIATKPSHHVDDHDVQSYSTANIHTMSGSSHNISSPTDLTSFCVVSSKKTQTVEHKSSCSAHDDGFHIASHEVHEARRRIEFELNKHPTLPSFADPVTSSQLPRADACLNGVSHQFDLEDELRSMLQPKFDQNPKKPQDHYRHTWE